MLVGTKAETQPDPPNQPLRGPEHAPRERVRKKRHLRYLMSSPVLAELVEAGVHFGHQTKRWNPKMKKFIMGSKNNIHILNIEETVNQIDKAADFLSDLARKNKKVLFV